MTYFSTDESPYFPWSWIGAAILIRIRSLISGCSEARPMITERLQDLLRHKIIPMILLRGSISSSGDLSPLSYICGAIQGISIFQILSRGHQGHVHADTVFTNASLEPVVLQEKEGCAITHSTTVSAAAAALTLHDTHGLTIFALLTAMSVEGLTGTTESFHPFFSEVRPHPGQVSPIYLLRAAMLLSRNRHTKDRFGPQYSCVPRGLQAY